ncbi:hypothetical protein PtB15_2B578 [Puccinia triticina]|nr:hypothetical protein PtB15_2B578 [Puccinia triticina]
MSTLTTPLQPIPPSNSPNPSQIPVCKDSRVEHCPPEDPHSPDLPIQSTTTDSGDAVNSIDPGASPAPVITSNPLELAPIDQNPAPKSTAKDPPSISPSNATENNDQQPALSKNNQPAASHPHQNSSTSETQNSTKSIPSNQNPGPTTSSGQPNQTGIGPQNRFSTNPPSKSPARLLTILKSDDVRIEVVRIHREFDGAKPSWQKYQTTWASLTLLQQSSCHHLPTNNAAKTPHPESTLVRFLYRLLHPAQTSISDWAKLVAASVELMADSLYVPPAPTAVHDEDQLIQGVQVLQHIEAIKNSSSSFDTVEDNPGEDSQPTQRSHSVDVLHEF